MKRLLFVVYETGNMTTALDLASHGQVTGAFHTVIWCPYYLPETAQFKVRAASGGASYVHETGTSGIVADIWTPLSGYWIDRPDRLPVRPSPDRAAPAALVAAVEALTGTHRDGVLKAADRDRRRAAFCEDLLVRLGIDAVAMSEDNAERDSFGWIAAAARRAIPTTVVSYGAMAPDEAQEAYRLSEAHHIDASLQDLFEEHLPHWLREGARGSIARLPPIDALGRVLAGFDRREPWIVNAGDVDRICLESPRMRDIYLEQGFAPDRLAVVGSPAFDRLHAKRQNRAAERERLAAFDIDPQAPLIVVAMPPDQTTTRPFEFGSYYSVLDVFTQTPRLITGAALVVTPHPNISPDHKDFLRARNIAVLDVPASDLIPLADLYVASVSTTIKWALACGVPVINYDIYGYQYREFTAADAVETIFDYSGFAEALRNWSDAERRSQHQRLAEAGAARWGLVDGRARDRIVGQVFEAAGSSMVPADASGNKMQDEWKEAFERFRLFT